MVPTILGSRTDKRGESVRCDKVEKNIPLEQNLGLYIYPLA